MLNPRFVIRSIIFLFVLFMVFTLYERNVTARHQNVKFLPPLYDLSIPVSNNGWGIEADVAPDGYREVYSASTAGRGYFLIDFVDEGAINPNIIPHPSLRDTWVIVAQRDNTGHEDQTLFVEIGCHATFQNGMLRCTHRPVSLPIVATTGDKCTGNLTWFQYSRGPHDARVFYGPKAPYTVFGSNSQFTCFGQVVQDFRSLWPWGKDIDPNPGFEHGTELQRPGIYGIVEKNYFLFWDQDGQVYAHYDISPKRAFAKLELDGSVGEDLGPFAARKRDESCMAKYMPHVGPEHESIHQATNSLSITMCKRSDPACKRTAQNTFIFTIFQWKTYIDFHSNYDPYIMLFKERAPFEVHGITTEPFWIHGRRKPNLLDELMPSALENRNNGIRPWDQTESFYITSMSWKSYQQKYHGYIDDVVFLAFGVEDAHSAGIDIVVGDMLMDVGLCVDA